MKLAPPVVDAVNVGVPGKRRFEGKLRVQVPLVVIVHVPDTVIWLVVPAMVTDETPPPPPPDVHVFGAVQV